MHFKAVLLPADFRQMISSIRGGDDQPVALLGSPTASELLLPTPTF